MHGADEGKEGTKMKGRQGGTPFDCPKSKKKSRKLKVRDDAPNSQYCENQAEFAANPRCEQIRSEFGEFKSNSLRICIPNR